MAIIWILQFPPESDTADYVSSGRLWEVKTIENLERLSLKVVAVAYNRWSLTSGRKGRFYCSSFLSIPFIPEKIKIKFLPSVYLSFLFLFFAVSRVEGSKGSMRDAGWRQKLASDARKEQKRYVIREFMNENSVKSIRDAGILFKFKLETGSRLKRGNTQFDKFTTNTKCLLRFS